MSLLARKTALRKKVLARRKAAFARANGAKDCALLCEVLAQHRGIPLAGFMPINTEIDPRPAMVQAALYGAVGVPVIRGENLPLLFSRWTANTPMIEGPFKACIPAQERLFTPQVVIVPLVAFDAKGGRLGYGGGFYDRTLQKLRANKTILAIGFAFDAQEAADVPQEPTDQPLDMIITQSRVIRMRK